MVENFKILAIEKNSSSLDRLRSLCGSDSKLDLRQVTSVSAGLDEISAEGADLILVGLYGTDLDDLDEFHRIRAAAPGLPIVVLLDSSQKSIGVRAVKDGAKDYLFREHLGDKFVKRFLCYVIEQNRLMLELTLSRRREDFLATHDPVTGLPNRELFLDRLTQALAQADRYGFSVSTLIIDLNRFKMINDSLGHAAADQFLKSVADRLSHCMRKSDTAARLGGDEFTVVLTNVSDTREVKKVAEKILDALSRPYVLDRLELSITGSIGIAISPGDGVDAQTLMKNADTALYDAKTKDGAAYRFFSKEMQSRPFDRPVLENRLREALTRDEFIVHYQPQFDITGRRLMGAEALVRWKHPERGIILPAEFISLAEDSGLIWDLGEKVLWSACREARAWHDKGFPKIRVSVNLSSRQFQNRNLAGLVGDVLRDTGIPAESLELEITESSILKDTDTTIALLKALKALGVRIAIDDFGTGYSSLLSLKRIPTDTLKIDRSFVRDINISKNDAKITTAIIAIAESMELETIAEGIETRAQLDLLRSQKCRQVQGFLFSKPVPAGEFSRKFLEIAAG